MTIREMIQEGVLVDAGLDGQGYDYAHEAKEWYKAADKDDGDETSDGQAAAALASIAASLIRIGDLLEAMKESRA